MISSYTGSFRWAGLMLTLVARGAFAQLSLLSPGIDEREAQSGQSYEGVLVIRNDSREPQEVKLYQTDYAFVADGRSLFDPPGTGARSNARWIAVGPDRLVIPAFQTARVPYRVSVPVASRDSLTGTFWSMVMVEPIPRGSAESSRRPAASPEPRLGLAVAVRYATQIVTQIGSSGAASITYDKPQVARSEDGRQRLSLDITNVGDRAHRLDIVLELYDAEGRAALRLTSKRGLVYPGSSIRQAFDVGTLRPGEYTAVIITDAGHETAFGTQYVIRF